MARITSYEGKIPKRINNCVIYPLEDQLIIRRISGFTSEGLLKNAKYELCRQNASEFGLVSKTCKAIRMLVADDLTRHNNLQVVNSLTKKMRSLLAYDTVHPRGSRNLKTALATAEAKEALQGYVFTPDFKLNLYSHDASLEVRVPDDLLGVSYGYLGFCVQYLFFDFDTLTGFLARGDWQMKALASHISFEVPKEEPEGFVLRLCCFSFFSQLEGEWLPVLLEQKGLVVF